VLRAAGLHTAILPTLILVSTLRVVIHLPTERLALVMVEIKRCHAWMNAMNSSQQLTVHHVS
jgi:hypothetical protein